MRYLPALLLFTGLLLALRLYPANSPGRLTRSTAETLVREQFRDPTSAQLRGIEVLGQTNGTYKVCGEVNAKNAFGGYVGYQPFYAEITPMGGLGTEVVLTIANPTNYNFVQYSCQ